MRYFIKVQYDGTAFHGSQVQLEINTVQLALNKSISTLLQKDISTFGASRTDEGVHALCNFYHFDVDEVLIENFLYKLNSILPPQLSVKSIYEAVDSNLNARFDAISRTYRYRIYHKKNPFLLNRAFYFPYKTDVKSLYTTASILKEQTDFESFSKRNTQSNTFKCNIYESYWEQKDDELHYIVTANRFLRGMVRAMVGTQLLIARGKISIADFEQILESKDCKQADFSVPGYGLYLEQIQYPEDTLRIL